MKKSILFALFSVLGWCSCVFGGLETKLSVDTAQPRAILTYLTTELGGGFDLRLSVRENKAVCKTLTTNDVAVFQYSTNAAGSLWATYSSTEISTNTGTYLIPVGPIGTSGVLGYQVYILTRGRKMPLGSGTLEVIETGGLGEVVATDFRQPLNTDVISMIGSNKFVRSNELFAAGVTWQAYADAIAAAITGSIMTERVDRVAGDFAGSNHVAAVRSELTNSITAISNLVVAVPAQTNQPYAEQSGTSRVARVSDRLSSAATITLTNVTDEAAGRYDVCIITPAETRIQSYDASNLVENVLITKNKVHFYNTDNDGAEYGSLFIKYIDWDEGEITLGFPSESGTLETQERVAGVLGGYAETNHLHSSHSGIEGAGTLHVSASETNLIATALQVEADTLQTVVNRGGTATNMGAVTMTDDLTMGANRVNGQRFGNDTGRLASGSGWGAYGSDAGTSAIHTNSHVFGRYAGRTARGDNRMYLDVYASNPAYDPDGATNDTVFMDGDGKLYLGGGAARAENPSAGGVLRGAWDIGAPTGSGANLTGVSWSPPPSATNSIGTLGSIAYTNSYFYVCIASNKWRRTILTDWE